MTKHSNFAIFMISELELIFYKELDGTAPVLEWLGALPKKVQAKGRLRIDRLGELGHALRRPEADYLREGIYELRWQLLGVHYRILYFFFGRQTIVLAHGLTKEQEIPERDIILAIQRKEQFKINPWNHKFI